MNDRIVREAKLQYGKKIELTVSGFNSSKTYNTYDVEVPLQFSNKVYKLNMIVLPIISTKFAADGISELAAGFLAKGYKLADPALLNDRNCVDNLDMVLGIDATRIFMEKVRTYGQYEENIFLETTAGVMPVGHSLMGYSGLKYLPEASKNTKVHNNARQIRIPRNNIGSDLKSDPGLSLPQVNAKTPTEVKKPIEVKKPNLVKNSTGVKKPIVDTKHNFLRKSTGVTKPTLEKKPNVVKKPNEIKKSNLSKKSVDIKKPICSTPIKSKGTQNLKSNAKKLKSSETVKSNVAVATPAVVEVSGSSVQETHSSVVGDTSKVATKNFSIEATSYFSGISPGYNKQQIFGDHVGFGSISDVDLENLLSETLGYDQYEKQGQYTDLDAKIVDYVYSRT